MQRRVEPSRRQWLRHTTLAALGGGCITAVGAGQPTPAGEKEAKEEFLSGPGCPQVLKLSKRLSGEFRITPGEPCKCECKLGDKVQTIFRVNYRSVLKFATVPPCDETQPEPLLPDGCELWLKGTL